MEHSDGIQLPDDSEIKALREGDAYKYLQSWTKLLRHSNRLGQIYALCYFVYPPPPLQCCFNLQNHLARMAALANNIAQGGGVGS